MVTEKYVLLSFFHELTCQVLIKPTNNADNQQENVINSNSLLFLV